MFRYLFILFLTVLSLISSNISYAVCENSCENSTNQVSDVTPKGSVEPNNDGEVPKTLFNYTKANVEVKDVDGVSIYTINQNLDSRYNIGYALGKAILLNHPDYSKDLRKYLDEYVKEQSQFKLDDVVESISKSLPCWLIDEMKGFADAVDTPEDGVNISYKDIVMLNSVVLWTRLPQKPPKAPPAAPTSVKPIKLKKGDFKKLSPVSPVSDQVAFVISINAPEVEGAFPLVGKTYKRHYYDFFDKYPCVTVYNLNNVSFFNTGFAGLLTVMSAMNNDGIVINTVQAPYQHDMSVVGSTPPNISARIAIEVSSSLSECQQVLNTQVSSIEMTYIINDENTHLLLDSNIVSGEKSKNEVIIDENKYFVFNIRNKKIVYHIQDKLKTAKISSEKLDLHDFINIITSPRMYNIDETKDIDRMKSVYSVVYSPAMRQVYVAMPPIKETEFDKKLIKLNFDTVELYEYSTINNNKEDNKYNNNEKETE